jgi:hypothetical protein
MLTEQERPPRYACRGMLLVLSPCNDVVLMEQQLRSSYAGNGDESDSSQGDGSGISDIDIKKAWDDSAEFADHLLFNSRTSSVDISALHPGPVQIFKLWQVYLENVNPLLKVTHTPTLQGRIVEAVSSLATIDPALEALMFSIYCVAILSLDLEECQTMLGSSRDDLLTRYQFGCQQALLNCNFLRTTERDCLTALFLYLVGRDSSAPCVP